MRVNPKKAVVFALGLSALFGVGAVYPLTMRARQERINRELIQALREGDSERAGALIRKGADPNSRDLPPKRTVSLISYFTNFFSPPRRQPYYASALMLAAERIDEDNARLLIEKGANVNAEDDQGTTPLIWLSSGEQISTVELLLRQGANVNAINNNGTTALMSAAAHDRTEALRSLLNAGARLDTQDREGWTALMVALSTDSKEAFFALVRAGANVNVRNNDGQTALMLALQPTDPDADVTPLVTALLKAGADVNSQDNNGWTALMFAVLRRNSTVVRTLLEQGAKPNLKNAQGETAATMAGSMKMESPQRRP